MASRPHEILIGIMDLEIFIPVEIIGEKTHPAFHRHGNRAQRHRALLILRKRRAYGADKALCERLVFLHIESDFFYVPFVLRARVRPPI